MLISVKSLAGYRVGTTEGLAGRAIDFNFDDRSWKIQHVVAAQNPARRERGVLLAPDYVQRIEARENVLATSLTRAEYDALPSAVSALPVCLQYDSRAGLRPSAAGDPHLRCTSAVAGNEISDHQQHLGIVHDFLIDTETWTIAFLVGRRFGQREGEFLVEATSVGQISFASRRVTIRERANWDLIFAERNGYGKLLELSAA